MRLQVTIVAVGKLGSGPERDLVARYAKRLRWPVREIELPEARQAKADARRADEAARIAAAVPQGAVVVALDERGKDLTSRDFADRLAAVAADRGGKLAIVIGGPDGLAPEFRQTADLVLSFGRLTWPHKLVRLLLLEQLYRASTILSGHPYHRD